MMMMMRRVMCVLAVVLCCTCGCTMTAAAAVDNDSPSGRGVSRGAVEVSCGAGGALRVRPAAASEWLTCGAGSRVSACGNYADVCRQRTARTARTTTIATTTTGQPKAVMAFMGSWDDKSFDADRIFEYSEWKKAEDRHALSNPTKALTHTKAKKLLDEIKKEELEKKKQEELKQQREREARNQQQLSEAREKAVQTQELQAGAEGLVAGSGTLAATGKQATAVTTNGTQTSEDIGSKKTLPQTEAKTAPDNSTVNHFDASQNPSPAAESAAPSDGNSGNHSTATPGTTAVSGSEETNTTIPSSTENTVSEESTATPPRDSNLTQQSTATDDVTAAPDAEETNPTTPTNPENTTTEASTTTPSPVPVPVTNPQISSIASAVQKKANADSSSISPLWMRTAAPLLIVAVLFSFTVY
ncbi:uncharacterized protein TM35_000581260 [Trypanosoma theileri]|uniref:Mucin-associated surface protein (MASP) n=1 Tax=Trypanosoma theileri TaxID=67003 RepID=A0A1X0NH25_9TRYP|nr:uncharacterized protein TM35_000581260 [Trypanosoma theileri]ORC83763.1 hypothetical protein TM35_000581260 [Trypanosoma theileri]